MALVRAGSARHREPLVIGGRERSRPANQNRRSHGIHRHDLGRRSSLALGSDPTSSDRQYAVEMDATEETPGQVTRRLLELLPAGSGSVGGALVGLALGGPGGALAGAAVEPVLEQVVSETLARRRARGQQALAVAASSVGITPGDLLDRILRDEQLLDLAAAVVAAASETMVEAKIRALGRALATGALATDDAVVENSGSWSTSLPAWKRPTSGCSSSCPSSTRGMGRLGVQTAGAGLTAGRLGISPTIYLAWR